MGIEGKTVLLTRASPQNAGFRELLEGFGAKVEEIPTIEIVEPEDWKPVDEAVARITGYDWVIFTSANAVDAFLERAGRLPKLKIAAVGSQTARRLEERGLEVDMIPARFNARELLERLPGSLRGVRILFPRAEVADETLPGELRERGANLDVVTVYRVGVPRHGGARLRRLLEQDRIDCIAFASGSSVRNLIEMLNDPDPLRLLAHPSIAAIGPVTRRAVIETGLEVDIEAVRATIPDLAEAIRHYYAT